MRMMAVVACVMMTLMMVVHDDELEMNDDMDDDGVDGHGRGQHSCKCRCGASSTSSTRYVRTDGVGGCVVVDDSGGAGHDGVLEASHSAQVVVLVLRMMCVMVM